MTQVISRLLKVLVYAYLLGVISVLMILQWTGDRWWFGTVLLYGPRWIYAFPLLVLAPLVLIFQRRSLWVLVFAGMLIVWPIMGLNVSLSGTHNDLQQDIRVLTYNVHRWDVMGDEFAELFKELQPDFAAVQECASPRRFKKELPTNWFTRSAGYSIVVSRHPISRCETAKRGREINGLYCVIDMPSGPVGFANVDLLTPRRALDKVLDRETIFDLSQVDEAQARIAQRWRESEQLSEWIQGFPEQDKVIAGDFNLTVDSPIYRSNWSDYQNAYSEAMFGYGHTKRTKINVFRYMSRIDHILSTTRLMPLKGWVGKDLGSDHLPLFADFVRIR